jgi:hypothetical protein
MTLPDRTYPFSGNDLIRARPSVLLPDPDSPTIPTDCPSLISNEIFSTAVNIPNLVL